MTASETQKKCFNQLYEEHKDCVYALCMKYSMKDSYLAEDAMQHTFFTLYLEMEKEVEIKNIQTFLHTVLKHYILNRKDKARRETLIHANEGTMIMEEADQALSAENIYLYDSRAREQQQLLKIVLLEMKHYNPTWYVIVQEVFIKERPQKEVAKELGITLTALHATIRRIRAWSNRNRFAIEKEACIHLEEVTKEISFHKNEESTHQFTCFRKMKYATT